MSDLPPDVEVECRVVNGEPEVFLSIEGTTFHLHPWDAHLIALSLGHCAREAQAIAHAPGAEVRDLAVAAQEGEP